MSLAGKRVVLVVPHQRYRDEELTEPRKVLEKAGAEVRVASSSLGLAGGMQGGNCSPDLLYSAVEVGDLDALVFVGGTGATEYFDDFTAHRLARAAVAQGKLLGAICFASSTLANAGVLEGLGATGFPSRELHLRSRGVDYTGEPVTVSGRIVTGRGPEDARAFGEALRDALATPA
jgi:protease I